MNIKNHSQIKEQKVNMFNRKLKVLEKLFHNKMTTKHGRSKI